jgi:hypothetical protein
MIIVTIIKSYLKFYSKKEVKKVLMLDKYVVLEATVKIMKMIMKEL